MTIQQFVYARTKELLNFQTYWFADFYPNLSYEEQKFWDYEATLWEWAEAYDSWKSKQNR
jgi:hypothetical protein